MLSISETKHKGRSTLRILDTLINTYNITASQKKDSPKLKNPKIYKLLRFAYSDRMGSTYKNIAFSEQNEF